MEITELQRDIIISMISYIEDSPIGVESIEKMLDIGNADISYEDFYESLDELKDSLDY